MVRYAWAGETLHLLAERAVYWERTRTLLVADPHLGKAASFRSVGIPVPTGTTTTDLKRLDAALDATGAERLIILGDLLHARSGRSAATLDAFRQWRTRRRNLRIALTRGNHDLRSGDPPAEWDIECVPSELCEPPFLFCHEPCRRAGYRVIAGHVHPAVRLEAPDGATVRLACFVFGPDCALLPAFGRFTGSQRLRPREGDAIFVVVDGQVLPVKSC